MSLSSNAETLIQENRPSEALEALQAEVRTSPAKPEPRVFLFQLLAVLGDWTRAQTQLDTLAKLYDDYATFAQLYRQVLIAERNRADVFAGKATPIVIGEPAPWLAQLIEAQQRDAAAQHAAAAILRQQALADAPTCAGQINEQPFSWLADADSRLGPVLEAHVNGQYRWIPFDKLNSITVQAPESLVDLVWVKAELELAGGQQTPALIPVRYPGTPAMGGALAMSRATQWLQPHTDTWVGLGQREFTCETGEFALLDVRQIRFDPVEE